MLTTKEGKVKIDQLERQIDLAQMKLCTQTKDLELKFDARKRHMMEGFSVERQEWNNEISANRNEINLLKESLKKTQCLLRDISKAYVRYNGASVDNW